MEYYCDFGLCRVMTYLVVEKDRSHCPGCNEIGVTVLRNGM